MSDYAPQGFRMLPPAVKNLLIINLIFFLATMVLERVYHSYLPATMCLYPLQSGLFRIWQPFTYMFMHGGLDHLVFNMFALWMFGYVLENFWGTQRFLIYYVLCGLGAAVVSILLPGFHVTLGASGAVYGILLAFGMIFPNERIFIFPLPIPIKAKWFITFYVVLELVSGIASYGNDNVAHFAHLGGMLFGYLLIRYWQKGRGRRNYYDDMGPIGRFFR